MRMNLLANPGLFGKEAPLAGLLPGETAGPAKPFSEFAQVVLSLLASWESR